MSKLFALAAALVVYQFAFQANGEASDRSEASANAALGSALIADEASAKSKEMGIKAEESKKKANAPGVSAQDKKKYEEEEKAALYLKEIYDLQAKTAQSALASNLNASKALGSAAGSLLGEYQKGGSIGVAKSLYSGTNDEVKNAATSMGKALEENSGAAAANSRVEANKPFSDYIQDGTFKTSSGETVTVPEGNRAAYSATSQDGMVTADEMRIGNEAVSVTTSDNKQLSYLGVQNDQHAWGSPGKWGLVFDGASGDDGLPYGFVNTKLDTSEIVNLGSESEAEIVDLNLVKKPTSGSDHAGHNHPH